MCWFGRGRPGPARSLWQRCLHMAVVRGQREATDLRRNLCWTRLIRSGVSPPSCHEDPLRVGSSAELPGGNTGQEVWTLNTCTEISENRKRFLILWKKCHSYLHMCMLELQRTVSSSERRHFCLILQIQVLTGGKHRGAGVSEWMC